MREDKIDCGDIVTLRDFSRMIEWKCMLVERMDEEKYRDIVSNDKYIFEANQLYSCETGCVWLYSPLGSSLYGKKVGEVLEYIILGKKYSCSVVKFIKGVKDYIK